MHSQVDNLLPPMGSAQPSPPALPAREQGGESSCLSWQGLPGKPGAEGPQGPVGMYGYPGPAGDRGRPGRRGDKVGLGNGSTNPDGWVKQEPEARRDSLEKPVPRPCQAPPGHEVLPAPRQVSAAACWGSLAAHSPCVAGKSRRAGSSGASRAAGEWESCSLQAGAVGRALLHPQGPGVPSCVGLPHLITLPGGEGLPVGYTSGCSNILLALQGAPGVRGLDGVPGKPGLAGEAGAAGMPGAAGPPGYPVSASLAAAGCSTAPAAALPFSSRTRASFSMQRGGGGFCCVLSPPAPKLRSCRDPLG
ncbi:hypothetical protein LUU34_00592600 [Aix galericulata]|nr:hypothetical protein LUU34_00592600 [Aix galericulata]